MKKPEKIKVGGQTINIWYTGKLSGAIVNFEPQIMGKFVPEESSIHIFEHLNSLQLTKMIMLHEIIHVIDNFMNTKLSEDQITQITNGLISVVKDNKDAIKYLFDLGGKDAN